MKSDWTVGTAFDYKNERRRVELEQYMRKGHHELSIEREKSNKPKNKTFNWYYISSRKFCDGQNNV